MQQPYDLTMTILFLRTYAKSKEVMDRNDESADMQGVIADLVWEHRKEQIEQMKAERDGR